MGEEEAPCTWSGLRPGLASFPQVAVVRQRDSGQIFAMKMLHKWEMLKRAEVSLGSSVHCKWVGEVCLLPGQGAGPLSRVTCFLPFTVNFAQDEGIILFFLWKY